MDTWVGMDLDCWVLSVVFLEVEFELAADFFREEGGANRRAAFGEEEQHGLVEVIVDEDDRFFGSADGRGGECVSVEDLAVEEDAMGGGCALQVLKRIEEGVETLVGIRNMTELPDFYGFDFLEKMTVLEEHTAHFHKCLNDSNADSDGCGAVEHCREHGHSLLGEGERWVAATAVGGA